MAKRPRLRRRSSRGDSGDAWSRSPCRSRTGSIIVFTLLAGCYSYVEAPPGDISLGEEVRVRLSAQERQRLRTDELFPYVADSFQGEVASTAGDTLALLVPVRSREWQTLDAGVNQKLHVTQAGIVTLEVRRFDGLRSGILAGAGTGLIVALLTHQLTGWFGGDTTQPEPPKDP